LHIAGGWLMLGQFEAALPAAQEAICLAEEEDLREVRARGLRLRSQAQNRQLRPFE
jgi:hypothetical protein